MADRVIAGLGEVLWDVYGNQKHIGGAPANFALHACRLGYRGLILSRVGNDPDGQQLIAALRAQEIETGGIQIDNHKPTGTVHVDLDAEGRPSFRCSWDVAFDYLVDYSDWLTRQLPLAALLYGTLAQRTNVARNTIQKLVQAQPARLIVYDANLRGIDPTTRTIVRFGLNHAHILKLNDDEVRLLPQVLGLAVKNEWDFYRLLLAEFPMAMICVTLGERGALLLSHQETIYSPGFQVPVVDTTGSGDAFIAAFVAAYLTNQSPAECLEFANALGALVATRKGAVPEYHPDEIEQLRRSVAARGREEKYDRFVV